MPVFLGCDITRFSEMYMPRVLIVYGTTDGHTEKVAFRLGEMFRANDVQAEVYHAVAVPDEVDPAYFDGVVVAASVHARGYQGSIRRWVRRHRTELASRPSAFLSVCLGVLQQDPAAQWEVRRIIENFLNGTGWKPTVVKPVAGALPWTRYGWLKRWVMQRIVARQGGDVDTHRNFEYTDWDDLATFVQTFALRIGARPFVPEATPMT